MTSGLFSIIIPTYNRKSTIERTIQSVINQTYINWECIIVDDGSTDGTLDIVIDLSKLDSRIKYVAQKNAGACNARNHGKRLCEGEYILFLDSDDEILPCFLERVVTRFKDDPNLGAVYSLTGIKRDGDVEIARKDILEGKDIYKRVLEQGYLTSTSFIAFKTDKILDIFWDESLPASQDDDFCFQVAKHNSISLIKEALGIYNTDSGNSIVSSYGRIACGWWMLWNKYEDDVKNLCGKEVLARHYYETAIWYYLANDSEGEKNCIDKISTLSDFSLLYHIKIKIHKCIICIKASFIGRLARILKHTVLTMLKKEKSHEKN